MSQRHPVSPFELDVYFASRAEERESESGAAIALHLVDCDRCRTYVDELEVVNARPPSLLLRKATPPRRARSRGARATIAAASVGLALAAGVLLYRARPEPSREDAEYVGVKGAPAAQILVRRSGQVRIWDTASPLRTGDSLAIRVACEHYSHASVVAGDAPAWEGACTSAPSPLPFTLVVDDQPGREHLAFALSRGPLDGKRLREALASGAQNRDVWVTTFEFTKENPR